MPYTEFPTDRIVDVHFKKKDDSGGLPPGYPPAKCLAYLYPQQTPFIAGQELNTSMQGGPNYGDSGGLGSAWDGGSIIAQADQKLIGPDFLDGFGNMTFSTRQLMFLHDAHTPAGTIVWTVPMVQGYYPGAGGSVPTPNVPAGFTLSGIDGGGHGGPGAPPGTGSGIPATLSIDSRAAVEPWPYHGPWGPNDDGGGAPASPVEVGLMIFHPHSGGGVSAPSNLVTGQPVVRWLNGGQWTWTYDFQWENWFLNRFPPIDYSNDWDPAIGGPILCYYVWRQESVSPSWVNVGSEYMGLSLLIEANCEPMPPWWLDARLGAADIERLDAMNLFRPGMT